MITTFDQNYSRTRSDFLIKMVGENLKTYAGVRDKIFWEIDMAVWMTRIRLMDKIKDEEQI